MKTLAEVAESYVKAEVALIRKLTGLDKMVTIRYERKKLHMMVQKPAESLRAEEKISWYMERFGKMLGEEVTYTAYGMVDKQDKATVEIEITIDIK